MNCYLVGMAVLLAEGRVHDEMGENHNVVEDPGGMVMGEDLNGSHRVLAMVVDPRRRVRARGMAAVGHRGVCLEH